MKLQNNIAFIIIVLVCLSTLIIILVEPVKEDNATIVAINVFFARLPFTRYAFCGVLR